MIPNYLMIPAIRWSPTIQWTIGSMDFDNPKVYSDTYITDGLVFNKLLTMNILCVYEYFYNVFFYRIVIKMFRSLGIPCCRPASSIQSTSTSSNQNPCLIIIIILIIQSEAQSQHHLYHPKPGRFCLTMRALIMRNAKLWEETWEIKAKTTRSPKFLWSAMVSVWSAMVSVLSLFHSIAASDG